MYNLITFFSLQKCRQYVAYSNLTTLLINVFLIVRDCPDFLLSGQYLVKCREFVNILAVANVLSMGLKWDIPRIVSNTNWMKWKMSWCDKKINILRPARQNARQSCVPNIQEIPVSKVIVQPVFWQCIQMTLSLSSQNTRQKNKQFVPLYTADLTELYILRRCMYPAWGLITT